MLDNSDFNRGTKYLEAGNYTKAIMFFKRQVKTYSFKELWLNMGNAYRIVDPSQVLTCYLRAARTSEPFYNGTFGYYSLAINNLGLWSYANGDDTAAIAFYNEALRLDPNYGEARWNLGNATLRSTNCALGWDNYEYRFSRGPGSVRIDNSLPMWDGKSCGASIYVLTEQGLGDKIMFGRYLSHLSKYFSNVVIVCDVSLDCIYAPYKCVRTVGDEANVAIPICSLARIFGIVPGVWLSAAPYDFGAGVNIGVCWNGSSTHANDHNRSCTSNYFSMLSSYGSLHSLSPDAPTVRGINALRPSTWTETASYVAGLDLIVSVDTSIVHLAGSLGVPTIMVQPLRETDFRWGNGSKPNVWYPSVVVVNNPNSWDATFATVKELMTCIKK